MAGAAILHLHARDPATGRGSMDRDRFREIVARIRDSSCDAILNLSTGEGGRFMPSVDEPSLAGPGTTLTRPENRIALDYFAARGVYPNRMEIRVAALQTSST